MNRPKSVYLPESNVSRNWIWVVAITAVIVTNDHSSIAEDATKIVRSVSHPRFEERLPAADGDARFAAAGAGLDDAERVALTIQPAAGLRITQVIEGGPAYKLGIRAGDILTRANGVALWNRNAFKSDDRRSIEYYSVSAKKIKTVKLPEGKIGVFFTEFWHPELVYLRDTSRTRTCDTEAFVGIVKATTDPELAETAWHRAFAKGYVADVHSAAAGLRIAFARGDWRLASEFAKGLHQYEFKWNDAVIHPVWLYRVALANGQLPDLLQIVEKYPEVFPVQPFQIQELIALDERQRKKTGNATKHIRDEGDFVRDNQIPDLMGYRVTDVESRLAALQQQQPITLSAPPGHFDLMIVAPPEPTPNIEFSMKFTWEPLPGPDGGFTKHLAITLVDNASSDIDKEYDFEQLRSTIMGFIISDTGIKTDENGEATNELATSLEYFPLEGSLIYLDPPFKHGEAAVHALRFVVIDGRGELYLDECRMLQIPLNLSHNQFALRLKAVGSQAILQEFRCDELVDRAGDGVRR